jgi:hypothetical protein
MLISKVLHRPTKGPRAISPAQAIGGVSIQQGSTKLRQFYQHQHREAALNKTHN